MSVQDDWAVQMLLWNIFFFFFKLKNQEATEYFELEGLTLTCVDTFKKVYFQKQMESSVPG